MYLRFLLIALLSVWSVGCGWEKKAVFESPSGEHLVEIQQRFPANGWGMRIQLRSGAAARTLYEQRGDVFLDFADVTWGEHDKTFHRVYLWNSATTIGIQFS